MLKKSLVLFSFFILLSYLFTPSVYSWGFFAHKRINRMAVFTPPPPMIGFYKKNLEYITKHAVDPDRRRYAVKGEAAKHYIDIDHYSKDNPFEAMPKRWRDAVEQYTEDTLLKYGILPWNIHFTVIKLTKAFEENDANKILRLSADIGHYVADAHVPLHTTENYNGQLTGQKGIHAFWESRLPELFAEEYDYLVGNARYVEDILQEAWAIVEASHAAKDSVLLIEKKLSYTFPSDKKYNYSERGKKQQKNYSEEYSSAYHQRMGGMVEQRMREAIIMVGSIWYTAWVNAGQPDLDVLKIKEETVSDTTKAIEFIDNCDH